MHFQAPQILNEAFPENITPLKTIASSQDTPAQFETPTQDAPLLIGTHSGTFHCDEVVATMLLTLLHGSSNIRVIRSRNPSYLAKCHIVVDVGAVYDPENHRYDHHQRGFEETFGEGYKTKLSSAGLTWKHFGKDILRKVYSITDQELVDRFYEKIYVNFFEHIDGIDNGIEVADGELNYKITTTLSARVGGFNPSWRDNNPDYSALFSSAMNAVFDEFNRKTERYTSDWMVCRKIVQEAFEKRTEVDPSGEILVLPTFCPWSEHLFEVEKQHNVVGVVKYVLFADQSGAWRIQAAPVENGSFTSRKALPAVWRGIRNEHLDELTGLSGCIFVHAAGFIGGHKTYEGVLEMAKKSLKHED